LDVQNKPLHIPLGEITPHKTFTEPGMIEHFIQTEFLLATPAKYLSKRAVYTLLELHPVQVIYSKRDGYNCIGGVRSFSIARNCLPPSDAIPVIHIDKMDSDAIVNHCLADIFLTTACLSIQSSESLYRYLQILPSTIKDQLLKPPCGTSQLARMLNVTRETVRKWKNKTVR